MLLLVVFQCLNLLQSVLGLLWKKRYIFIIVSSYLSSNIIVSFKGRLCTNGSYKCFCITELSIQYKKDNHI